MNKALILFLTLFLFTSLTKNVHAAEYTYQPEGCDFTVTLPTVPSVSKRCRPGLINECDLKTTYTEVFEFTSTVNVYLTCEPIDAKSYQSHNKDTLRTILIALSGGLLETYQADTNTDNTAYKNGMILGTGYTANKNLLLYAAQVWVSENSSLIVEAELIGPEQKDADKTLIDILHSVQYAGTMPVEPVEAPNPEDTETDNTAGDKPQIVLPPRKKPEQSAEE